MTIDQDTKKLIRRTRIILSIFLVGIGGLLVYTSTQMDNKEPPTVPAVEDAQEIEQFSKDDVFVILKDSTENTRGLGVLVGDDGTVLTNKHVVKGVEENIVVNYKMQDYLIDYVGLHPYDDYALVRIYDIETACIAVDTTPLQPQQQLVGVRPARSSYAFGPLEAIDTTTIKSSQPIVEGMSGTPLITEEGKLAALLQARDELTENQAKVAPITESIQARIAKTTSTETCRRVER